MKLLLILFFITPPTWSFWCYTCDKCNPDYNHGYQYCSGPYCELSFLDGRRDKARQRCSETAFELGCTLSWEGGRNRTSCYCNSKGCNDANVSKLQFSILILSLILMFLVWIKKAIKIRNQLICILWFAVLL